MSNILANTLRPNPPSGDWFRWAHNTLTSLQEAVITAGTVTNMRATALAGAVQVNFTRSDGDGYTLYKNSIPSTNGATRIDLGTANSYTDDLGAGSITRYYLVVTKAGNRESVPSVWVSATSLALGTPATLPAPPPASDIAFTDTESESVAVQTANNGSYVPL